MDCRFQVVCVYVGCLKSKISDAALTSGTVRHRTRKRTRIRAHTQTGTKCALEHTSQQVLYSPVEIVQQEGKQRHTRPGPRLWALQQQYQRHKEGGDLLQEPGQFGRKSRSSCRAVTAVLGGDLPHLLQQVDQTPQNQSPAEERHERILTFHHRSTVSWTLSSKTRGDGWRERERKRRESGRVPKLLFINYRKPTSALTGLAPSAYWFRTGLVSSLSITPTDVLPLVVHKSSRRYFYHWRRLGIHKY